MNEASLSQATCLGGINMVDYLPWRKCDLFLLRSLAYPVVKEGNYTNTLVRDNFIYGGFASSDPNPSMPKGVNNEDAIIKSVANGSLFSSIAC